MAEYSSRTARSVDLDSVRLELGALEVRPVKWHKIWPLVSYGDFAPTDHEWSNNSPMRLGSDITAVLHSTHHSLRLQALMSEGFPVHALKMGRTLGMYSTRHLKAEWLQTATVRKVTNLGISHNRTLPMIMLGAATDPATDTEIGITLPDLACFYQDGAVDLVRDEPLAPENLTAPEQS